MEVSFNPSWESYREKMFRFFARLILRLLP